MVEALDDDKTAIQYKTLATGTPREKLEVLVELYATAKECRARADVLLSSSSESFTLREAHNPWRQFRDIIGEPLFDIILTIVRLDQPSDVRALAGDILAHLGHPEAVGRLLEDYENHRNEIDNYPPLAIYGNLGRIGTDAAARALIWLWGTKWDADIAGALGRCNSDMAQDFLLMQARAHSSVHVRSMCMGNLKAPVTKEKVDLFLDRLENGEYNECFTAIYMINILRVESAANALLALRAKTGDKIVIKFIKETLLLLEQSVKIVAF